MNMNSFEGKRILALIRDGDYAHAGEEEAIERALRSIPKSSLRINCAASDGSNAWNRFTNRPIRLKRAVDFFASARLCVRPHLQRARYFEPPSVEIQKGF